MMTSQKEGAKRPLGKTRVDFIKRNRESNRMSAPQTPIDSQINLLRAEIAQLKRERDGAEKAKTEYMQNVAHQLAAPINAIKMNIDTLKNPRVPTGRKTVLLNSIYFQ